MISSKLYKYRLLLDKLSLRERYLMLIVIFSLIIGLTQITLIFSGLTKYDAIDNSTQQYKTEVAAFENALIQLESSVNSPSVITLQNDNLQLETTLHELDERIDRISTLLITPTQMVNVLKQLIAEQPGLSLQQFKGLPPQPLQTNIDTDSLFYQHTVELTLAGDLDTFVGYLNKIENLGEHLFWDELNVSKRASPTFQFKLKVHTLSRQEVWLIF